MNNKSLIIFGILVCILLISSFASGSSAGSTIAVTDPKHDVTEYKYPSLVNGAQTKDEIDLVSVEYGKNTNGNMTITLNLVGKPRPDNQTFYWVTLDGDNLTAVAWAGAYDDTSTYCLSSCSWLTSEGAFSIDYQNNSAVISGSSITWTFPRQVAKLNDSYQFEMVDANLPDTPNATWTWNILTWTGNTPYSSVQTSGTWWIDTLNDASGSDSTDTSGTGTPSFEIVPVISVLLIISFIAIVKKRKKIKKL